MKIFRGIFLLPQNLGTTAAAFSAVARQCECSCGLARADAKLLIARSWAAILQIPAEHPNLAARRVRMGPVPSGCVSASLRWGEWGRADFHTKARLRVCDCK